MTSIVRPGPVVVGMDGSPPSWAALHWAATAASARNLPLTIALAGDVRTRAEIAAGSPDSSRALLQQATDALLRTDATCPIQTVLSEEQPRRLLEQLSDGAEMIVLGAGREGRIAAMLNGSVTPRLARYDDCPVVVVPAGWRNHRPAGHPVVVVGVCDSTQGVAALNFAVAHAWITGGRVEAVHCTTPVRSRSDVRDVASDRDIVDRLVGDVADQYPGVRVITHFARGDIEAALRGFAATADLVVVGRRRQHAGHDTLTARLSHRMPCPVAVVGLPAGARSAIAVPTAGTH